VHPVGSYRTDISRRRSTKHYILCFSNVFTKIVPIMR